MARSDFTDFCQGQLQYGTAIIDFVYDTERGYARGPERALLSALLFDGIQSYMNYALAATDSAKNKYMEAYSWVLSTNEDYVFSFNNVCNALGIDAQYFRLGLLNAYNSQGTGWKKARRNF